MTVVEYDRDADALYVQFADEDSARRHRIDDLRLVDYNVRGDVIGVELLGVSERLDLTGVPRAEDISRAIRESGLQLPAPAA